MEAVSHMKRAELIFFSLVGLVLLVVLAASFAPQAQKSFRNTPENYARAKAAEVAGNPCATPPGYTDAQWRQHMSHHPDQYPGCLK